MNCCCIWLIIAICAINGGHGVDWGGPAPAMPEKSTGETHGACGLCGLNCGAPDDILNEFAAGAT